MTYYKIMKYLKEQGLSHGKADYMRGMIRQLVYDKGGKVLPRKATCSCGHRDCPGGCYEY